METVSLDSYMSQFGSDKKAIKVFWAKNPEVNWTFIIDKNNTVADLFEDSQVPDGYYLYLYERKKLFGLWDRDRKLNYDAKVWHMFERSDGQFHLVVDKSKKKPSDRICGASNVTFKPIADTSRTCSFQT